MYLKHIIFENIRNHKKNEIFFEPNINVFFGPNGSGKTSILEAISIGTFSKSFVTNFDQHIVKIGENYYSIEISAISDQNIPVTFSVIYHSNKKKEIRNNAGQLISAQELIGTIPIVVLFPDMKEIIFGPPNSRREFVDKIISQTDRNYLKKLLEYRRILKQRNKLLLEISNGNKSEYEVLSLWDEKLIDSASTIIHKRALFCEKFSPYLAETYEVVSNGKEKIDFKYSPFLFKDSDIKQIKSPDEIKSLLNEQLNLMKEKEIERGTSLFGPHKDDFKFILNDVPANEVASQGQSKSILIATKYSEIKYLQKEKGTTPIVLFDDIFSELDFFRISQVLNSINELNVQLFITMTEIKQIWEIIPNFETYGIFKVENGRVEKLNSFS